MIEIGSNKSGVNHKIAKIGATNALQSNVFLFNFLDIKKKIFW